MKVKLFQKLMQASKHHVLISDSLKKENKKQAKLLVKGLHQSVLFYR